MRKNKIFFISNSGGHLAQLLKLKPLFDKYDYLLITERKKANLWLKNRFNTYFTYPGGTGYNFTFFLNLFLNFFVAFFLLLKNRPKLIVTTGSYTVLPFIIFSKIFRIKTIYILTYARINSQSKADMIFYKLSDEFIIQWEEQIKNYPKAKLLKGGIY